MDEKEKVPIAKIKITIFGINLGSNPCPSFNSLRSYPLHYRCVLNLSIALSI